MHHLENQEYLKTCCRSIWNISKHFILKTLKTIHPEYSKYFNPETLMLEKRNIFPEILNLSCLYIKISAYTDGGPRSRVCARETLRSAPHRRTRKISGTRVCIVTLKHLPKPIVASSRTLWGTS